MIGGSEKRVNDRGIFLRVGSQLLALHVERGLGINTEGTESAEGTEDTERKGQKTKITRS